MNVFEQRRYRDPLLVLIEEEARTCRGCAFSAVLFDRQYCTKNKKHGKRCTSYQEKGKS